VAALQRLLIALLEQHGAYQTRDGAVVGEDAHDVGAPLDLSVQSLRRVGAENLQPVRLREVHVGQHFVLGAVHQTADLGELTAQLVGHHAPLFVRVPGRGLGEDGGHGCADHTPLRPADVRRGVAHEVHAAALSDGIQQLGYGGFDAFVAVADDELDATLSPLADLRGGGGCCSWCCCTS